MSAPKLVIHVNIEVPTNRCLRLCVMNEYDIMNDNGSTSITALVMYSTIN